MLLGARLPGLRVEAVHHGVTPHAWSPSGLLASRGLRLIDLPAHQGDAEGVLQQLTSPPAPLLRRALARTPWLAPALRRGIHGARRLSDGVVLAITAGACWRGEPRDCSGVIELNWSRGLVFEKFRRPTRNGLLVHDDCVWLAQYALNQGRTEPMHLWYSDDGGRVFRVKHTFAAGDVRHIHFIQRDRFSGHLWMGTGDRDAECRLLRSVDQGTSWEVVGGGDQRYRAIGLGFTPKAVIWGTDAGRDAGAFRNRAMRWDRATERVEPVAWLQGPTHGVTATKDGAIWLTTGVEGGHNELDRRVHIWQSADDMQWRELASFAAGMQPRRAQYAVAHFPAGAPMGDDIWMGLRGVMAGDVVAIRARRSD